MYGEVAIGATVVAVAAAAIADTDTHTLAHALQFETDGE